MAEPTHYRIKNWTQFQHYKDRSPEWIKLHFAILASEDWTMLADASKLLAIVCMLVASRHGGMVPNKPAYLKRVAYLDSEPDLAPLISCGFLEIPQADASEPEQMLTNACLDKRRGEKKREDKKDRGADAPAEMAFVGKVIRLTVGDFDRWAKRYHLVPDMLAELTLADDYYSENPPKDGKWFFSVSKWLERAHNETLKPKADPDAAIYRNVL
jgi:hypothetical protein